MPLPLRPEITPDFMVCLRVFNDCAIELNKLYDCGLVLSAMISNYVAGGCALGEADEVERVLRAGADRIAALRAAGIDLVAWGKGAGA